MYFVIRSSFRDLSYNYDPTDHEEQQDSYVGHGGILAFPDLLAPAARMDTDAGYMQDYGYSRERPRSHASTYFDTSSFNVSNRSDLISFSFFFMCWTQSRFFPRRQMI